MLSQASKYGADVSAFISPQGGYVWHDFTSFLKAYDGAAALFRTHDDYALLAETYLRSLAAEGAIYSEFFISTDHAREAGLSPRPMSRAWPKAWRAPAKRPASNRG